MVNKTNDERSTQEELIREAIGMAATHLIRKGMPVTARALIHYLHQEEERAESQEYKDIYQAARKRVQLKMQ